MSLFGRSRFYSKRIVESFCSFQWTSQLALPRQPVKATEMEVGRCKDYDKNALTRHGSDQACRVVLH